MCHLYIIVNFEEAKKSILTTSNFCGREFIIILKFPPIKLKKNFESKTLSCWRNKTDLMYLDKAKSHFDLDKKELRLIFRNQYDVLNFLKKYDYLYGLNGCEFIITKKLWKS